MSPASDTPTAVQASLAAAVAREPHVAALIYIPIVAIGGSGNRLGFGTPAPVVLKNTPGQDPGHIVTTSTGDIDMSGFKVRGDVLIMAHIDVTSGPGRWRFYHGPKGNDPYMGIGIATTGQRNSPGFKPMFGKPAYPDEFSRPVFFNDRRLLVFIDIDDVSTPFYYQFQLENDNPAIGPQYLDPQIRNRSTD